MILNLLSGLKKLHSDLSYALLMHSCALAQINMSRGIFYLRAMYGPKFTGPARPVRAGPGRAYGPPGPCRPLVATYDAYHDWHIIVTGPPIHSVGAVLFCSLASVSCRRLSSSVTLTLYGGPAGGFTRTGQAMTSCRLQSNYSFTVTLHGGPVVLRPVMVTTC